MRWIATLDRLGIERDTPSARSSNIEMSLRLMLQYRDMLPRTALSATGGTSISSELQRRYIRSIVTPMASAQLRC
jgi:hypothetical protein